MRQPSARGATSCSSRGHSAGQRQGTSHPSPAAARSPLAACQPSSNTGHRTSSTQAASKPASASQPTPFQGHHARGHDSSKGASGAKGSMPFSDESIEEEAESGSEDDVQVKQEFAASDDEPPPKRPRPAAAPKGAEGSSLPKRSWRSADSEQEQVSRRARGARLRGASECDSPGPPSRTAPRRTSPRIRRTCPAPSAAAAVRGPIRWTPWRRSITIRKLTEKRLKSD